MLLKGFDWDLITPAQAARIEQTPGILGGKPRLRGTRISVAQVVGMVTTNGIAGAAKEILDIQPGYEDAFGAVEAALRFAEVALDRRLPDQMGEHCDWYGKVEQVEVVQRGK